MFLLINVEFDREYIISSLKNQAYSRETLVLFSFLFEKIALFLIHKFSYCFNFERWHFDFCEYKSRNAAKRFEKGRWGSGKKEKNFLKIFSLLPRSQNTLSREQNRKITVLPG